MRFTAGNKVFDLARGSVTKVFLPNTAQRRISQEIAAALASDRLSFAPGILGHSLDHRWYAETYIQGALGSLYYGADLNTFWERFDRDIARCLEQILLLERPRRTRLDQYALRTVDRVRRRVVRAAAIPEDAARVILGFVAHTHDDLQAAGQEEIWLGFSHGDFSMANILRAGGDVAVIDWESAGRRSLLYDLYSYLFGELYFGRAQPPSEAQLNRAIRSLGTRLRGKLPEPLRIGGTAATQYRRGFYLERLRVLSERCMQDELFAGIALRTVAAFCRCEAGLENPECTAPVSGYHRVLADARRAERPRASRPRPPARPGLYTRVTRAFAHGLLNMTGRSHAWACVAASLPW